MLMRYLRALAIPPARRIFQLERHMAPGAGGNLLHPGPARDAAANALAFMADRHHLRGSITLATSARRPCRLSGQRHPGEIGSHVDGAWTLCASAASRRRSRRVRAAIAGALEGRLAGPGKRILRALAKRTYGVNLSRAKKQDSAFQCMSGRGGPARPPIDDLLSPHSPTALPQLNATAMAPVVADHLSAAALTAGNCGNTVPVAWHRQQIQRAPSRPVSARPIEVNLTSA